MAGQDESSTKMVLRAPTSSGRERSRSVRGSGQKKPALLWAVDPTANDVEFAARVGKVASLWAKTLETEVTPISVVSYADIPWLEDVTVPLKEILMPAAFRNIREMMKKIGVENARDPRILQTRENVGTRRAAVQVLVAAARRMKASAIIVATRGPGMLERIRTLGGFTEKLIALSSVPVVVVNPKTEPPRQITRILLPTDFTPASRRVFLTVLQVASRIGARITLFHVSDLAFRSLTLAGEWGMSLDPVLVAEAWEEEGKRKKKAAESWKDLAARRGVTCDSVFASSRNGLGVAILEAEKRERADMIAMTTYAGPIEQVILGSVARDVINGATKPVLIVRSKSVAS